MSTIDLLRHGEPEGGVRYRGDGVDDPLSERGWEQMWAAVGEFADWTHMVSSPLRRCRNFAEAMAKRYGLPLVVDRRVRRMSGSGTSIRRTCFASRGRTNLSNTAGDSTTATGLSFPG